MSAFLPWLLFGLVVPVIVAVWCIVALLVVLTINTLRLKP